MQPRSHVRPLIQQVSSRRYYVPGSHESVVCSNQSGRIHLSDVGRSPYIECAVAACSSLKNRRENNDDAQSGSILCSCSPLGDRRTTTKKTLENNFLKNRRTHTLQGNVPLNETFLSRS